jgi:hypothetical protein
VSLEFKVERGNTTELKANSLSAGCEPNLTRNFSNARAGFPWRRLLATPKFLIPLAPPASQHNFLRLDGTGEAFLIGDVTTDAPRRKDTIAGTDAQPRRGEATGRVRMDVRAENLDPKGLCGSSLQPRM